MLARGVLGLLVCLLAWADTPAGAEPARRVVSLNPSLTATLVADVSDGTLNLNADGSFDYTPDGGFTGVDTFTYTITIAGFSLIRRRTHPSLPASTVGMAAISSRWPALL